MNTESNNGLEQYHKLNSANKQETVNNALQKMIMEIIIHDTNEIKDRLINPSGWLNGYCESLASGIAESALVFNKDNIRIMALKSMPSDEARETVVLEAANKMIAALENGEIKQDALDNPGRVIIDFISQRLKQPGERASTKKEYRREF